MNSAILAASLAIGSWGWSYQEPTVIVYPPVQYAAPVFHAPQQYYQPIYRVYPIRQYTAPVIQGSCVNGRCYAPRTVRRYQWR